MGRLLLFGLAACTGRSSDDPDTAGDSWVLDTALPVPFDPGGTTWDAEAPVLVPGGATDWIAGGLPTDSFDLQGNGFTLGEYRPLADELAHTEPLEDPAHGDQVYRLVTVSADGQTGWLYWNLLLVESFPAGTHIHLSAALGVPAGDELPPPTVHLMLAGVTDTGAPAYVDFRPPTVPPPGRWSPVDLDWTTSYAGQAMYLLVAVEGTVDGEQTALLDNLIASWD